MTETVDWKFIEGQEGDWSIGYVPNVADRQGRIRSGTTIVSGFDLGQQTRQDILNLGLSDALTQKLLPFARKQGADAVMAQQRSFENALDALSGLNRQQTGHAIGSVGHMKPSGIVGGATGPRLDREGRFRIPTPGQRPTHFVAGDTILRLDLDDKERAELTRAVHASYYRRIARRFDLSSSGKRFGTLAGDIQTALVSLSYHVGSIWKPTHNASDVFAAAVKRDWAAAVDALRGGPIFVLPKYEKFRARRRAEAALIIRGAKLDPYKPGPKERAYLERVVERGATRARTA